MNWTNLKNNKCPKCGKYLQWGDEPANTNAGDYLHCSCGFVIGERRATEIINSKITAEIEERLTKEYE